VTKYITKKKEKRMVHQIVISLINSLLRRNLLKTTTKIRSILKEPKIAKRIPTQTTK